MHRVFAWVLLIGFVFLLVDILIIGWHRQVVATIYAMVVVVYFLFFMNRKSRVENTEQNVNEDADKNAD